MARALQLRRETLCRRGSDSVRCVSSPQLSSTNDSSLVHRSREGSCSAHDSVSIICTVNFKQCGRSHNAVHDLLLQKVAAWMVK